MTNIFITTGTGAKRQWLATEPDCEALAHKGLFGCDKTDFEWTDSKEQALSGTIDDIPQRLLDLFDFKAQLTLEAHGLEADLELTGSAVELHYNGSTYPYSSIEAAVTSFGALALRMAV